jgi:haloalkane dehalogenase
MLREVELLIRAGAHGDYRCRRWVMKSMAADAWQKLYPFGSHWRQLAAGRYHYLDEGAGTPLLMVHGNPTWSFYWRRLIAAFRDSHRIVAPDHIGCGLSDKPQDYPYQLKNHIDNLVDLIEHLDLREITLLGHDWGGAIGLGAALACPERFARFVLLNTGAFPPPFIPWRIRVCRTPLLGRWAVQGLNLFARAAQRMAVHDPHCLATDVRAGLIAPYDTWSHRIAVYQFVKDIPGSSRHATWQTLQDIEDRLPTFAQRPVQLVWGLRDWCFRPSCLERLQRHFPHARVTRLPQAGHWVVEEAPEEVESCLREFLGQTGAWGRASIPRTHPSQPRIS